MTVLCRLSAISMNRKKDVPTEITSCLSAMFISYFTFEAVLWLMPDIPLKMAVAVGGLAAFSGTDIGMALSEALVDFIKNKLRSKT